MIPGAGFLQTIILLGAIQGFIVSALLFFPKQNRQSNRLLALLIFLMAFASFNLYGNYVNWFNSDILRFITEMVPMVIVMPFGPLIFFYTKAFLDPGFRITKKHRPHFYPVIVDLVPHLAVILFVIGVVFNFIKNDPKNWANFIDHYNVYADIPRWTSVTFYVWLSSKYISAVRAKNNASSIDENKRFKWLQQFLRVFLVFQVIWFIYLIPYEIPRYSNALLDSVGWYPIYVPLAVIIYWLGIKGYLVSHQQDVAVKRTANTLSSLSVESIEQTTLLLKKAMQDDKLYLNLNCNLTILSQHSGIAQKVISAVLNQHEHKSFSEFINGYRVAACKERILQPENNHLTIAGIALECGFNSQATFQRTFKELTGMAPSEFRKKRNRNAEINGSFRTNE